MQFYLMLIIAILTGCDSLPKKIPADICPANQSNRKVEDINLNDPSRIKQLHGQLVRVEGVFHYNFEDVAIYPLSDRSADHALWLGSFINVANENTLNNLNGKHIVLAGKIDTTGKGHFGAYIATLDSIYCIQER